MTIVGTDKDIQAGQIGEWLNRHNLALREMTDRDAERVGKLYHAAMALDFAEASLEDAKRTIALIRSSYCPNDWHRSAPARAKLSCPECF